MATILLIAVSGGYRVDKLAGGVWVTARDADQFERAALFIAFVSTGMTGAGTVVWIVLSLWWKRVAQWCRFLTLYVSLFAAAALVPYLGASLGLQGWQYSGSVAWRIADPEGARREVLPWQCMAAAWLTIVAIGATATAIGIGDTAN